MNSPPHDEFIAEIADLKKQLAVFRTSEQEFLNAVEHTLEKIKTGEHARLDPDHYSDVLKELAISVNTALEQGEKAIFYQSVLDSLSIPISVTDLNENWTFINKKTEKVLNVQRDDVIGTHCSLWGSSICNTEECAIKALRRGKTEARFEQKKKHYKTFVSYVRSPNGDAIGHVEAVVNVTELVWTVQYMKSATIALVKNLEKVANGDFSLPHPVPPLYPGAHNTPTLDIVASYFNDIFHNMEVVIGTVREILSDFQELTVTIHDGRLDYRSDLSSYHGEFKQVASLLNQLLDFIFKPIHDAIRVCECYAAGDFTARTTPDDIVEGEFKKLQTSLDMIGIDISHQLHTISTQMDELSRLTEHAREGLKIGMEGVEQMLVMTEQISKSSVTGSEHIAQVVRVVDDLNLSVGETATKSDLTSHTALQASEYARAGMEQTEKSELVMEGISDSTRVIEVTIKDINVQMDEIGKIVQLISDISSQTNLLALNAAIEAARAGDAGRGFAVVASEVKALAQDSRHSADNITHMISSLQEKVKKADKATNEASTVVQQGKVAVNENLSMLNKIVTSVGDISHNITDVASFAEEQARAVQEVTCSITTVADQINHSSRQIEEVLTIVQETGIVITRSGDVFDEIHSTTGEIRERIAQFKLSDE